MFESVAAFDGDSTMIKTFPSAELFEVLAVFVVLVFAADEVFSFVFSFTRVLAVFFDAGIVITPVKKFFLA